MRASRARIHICMRSIGGRHHQCELCTVISRKLILKKRYTKWPRRAHVLYAHEFPLIFRFPGEFVGYHTLVYICIRDSSQFPFESRKPIKSSGSARLRSTWTLMSSERDHRMFVSLSISLVCNNTRVATRASRRERSSSQSEREPQRFTWAT